MTKRVAILVGGGDVPGLNICLKSLVYRLIDDGFDLIGVRKGWEGLIRYNPLDPTTFGENFLELSKPLVRPIDRSPGSFLHASRINPLETPRNIIPEHLREEDAQTQDMTSHIQEVIALQGFHALVTIGDDDMLEYAAYLSNRGVPIVAIPKTIHNNINGTEYTIGYTTGLARGVAFIHDLRALAASREQVMVVETYGVKSGLSSLMLSFLAGVDRAIIPEVPFDPERLAKLATQDKQQTPGNYAVVTVTNGSSIQPDMLEMHASYLSPQGKRSASSRGKIVEQAGNVPGHIHTAGSLDGSNLASCGIVTAELLQKITGEEVFLQSLVYLLRTGPPDGQDLFGATNFAILAAQLVKENQFGRMTSSQPATPYSLTHVDLNVVTEGPYQVDVDLMYAVEEYKPKLDVIWAAKRAMV